jgi:hypothetical protein
MNPRQFYSNKALAELQLLERGNSAMKPSHAVTKPAYIRVIKRRHRIPSLPLPWDLYATTNPYKQGTVLFYFIDFDSHIRVSETTFLNPAKSKRGKNV